MPNIDWNHGGADNGGTAAFLAKARSGSLFWDWCPDFMWEARIGWDDLVGPAASQRASVTIPSSGFTSGRLTVTISGGGLASPVAVTADAAIAEDQDDLALAAAAAIDALVATTLAGVVTSADVDGTSANVFHVDFVRGIARATVAVSYRPAQRVTATFGGTLLDGTYGLRFVNVAGALDVTVPVVRTAGTPAAAANMAAAAETAIEAEALLNGWVISADDSGAANTLIFEPDVATVTVTSTVPAGTTLTFAGTATNGAYATTFTHSSIPGGSATVTTTRAAGTPAANSDLAAQHEADIEADGRLSALIASADDSGAANTVLGYAGVTGLTFSTSAPAPGTLTSAPPTLVVADATPAGPTVTVAYSVTLALGSIAGVGPFPDNVWRGPVALEVVTAFGANRTITVGDADDADGLLGSTPVTLNSTGRTLSIAADAQHVDRYEGTAASGGRLVPTATIALGSSNTITTGLAFVQIDYAPHPSNSVNVA